MRVSDTNYTLLLVAEDGQVYDISSFAEDLGWEENVKELATTISFTVVTSNEELISILNIGCVVAVLTDDIERARGRINKVKVKVSGSREVRTVTAYDELFCLKTSEDQLYFSAGQSTKAILSQIFGDWGVPLGEYTGADVTHEKLVYRTGTLADTIMDILDDAYKKGGPKTILRASQGKIDVVKRGGNEEVYEFDENDTVSAEQEVSIANLVTRVKVLGQTDDKDGVPPVEATADGLTQFGIRQKIYVRDKDTTEAEAKEAVMQIFEDEGKVSMTQSLVAPDVPELRKGHVIYVNIGELSDYYYVTGIRHDASSGTMTVDFIQRES